MVSHEFLLLSDFSSMFVEAGRGALTLAKRRRLLRGSPPFTAAARHSKERWGLTPGGGG